MNETFDIVEQLRNELDETLSKPKVERSRSVPKPSPSKKSKRKIDLSDLFAGGKQRSTAKNRIIVEVEAEVANRFKKICRDKHWTQKSILERFIQGFVDHHSND